MNEPVISFVVTSYNYKKYLPECISSILNQRISAPIELIIVDDGSADGSRDIIKELDDIRISSIMLQNEGTESASNHGIRAAKAPYVVRVDADDYLLPDFSEIALGAADSNDFGFIYCDYVTVDEESNLIRQVDLPPFDFDEITQRGDFLATGTLYRTDALKRIGLYDESVKNCGLENYSLVLRLLLSGEKGIHVPKPTFAYRRHDSSASSQRRNEILNYGKSLFKALDIGEYGTNKYHPYLGCA